MKRVRNCRVGRSFFARDALAVAPDLLGKCLVRRFDSGELLRLTISEVEVYRGEEDLACHASRGRTPRTEVMYEAGGVVYVYLIYGIYWLLNFVTGAEGHPQAVLIRGCREISGPGRVGKALWLDGGFYGEELSRSDRLWVEFEDSSSVAYHTSPRIGIDYAGSPWREMPWRFFL